MCVICKKSCYEKKENAFFSDYWLSNCLQNKKNGSQECIVRWEFGFQNQLPDGNLALKITYRTRIWPLNVLSGHDFSYW